METRRIADHFTESAINDLDGRICAALSLEAENSANRVRYASSFEMKQTSTEAFVDAQVDYAIDGAVIKESTWSKMYFNSVF